MVCVMVTLRQATVDVYYGDVTGTVGVVGVVCYGCVTGTVGVVYCCDVRGTVGDDDVTGTVGVVHYGDVTGTVGVVY